MQPQSDLCSAGEFQAVGCTTWTDLDQSQSNVSGIVSGLWQVRAGLSTQLAVAAIGRRSLPAGPVPG
jgi:hypothetical protein